MEQMFLVVNSGSSSEKFSLFENGEALASLYFEGVEKGGKKQFICTLTREGEEEELDKTWNSLDVAFVEAKAIFEERGFINEAHPLDAILVRVVAAGWYFAEHHIVDEQTFEELKKVEVTNPLHVPGTLRGIKNAQKTFTGVPVMVISDSEALCKESRRDFMYALPSEVIAKYDLARWGAHGSSYGYMIGRLKELDLVSPKMIVCHLGSGCSVTAFVDGEPTYTSMGETPLEGLMSSTRTGSIDPTIGALLGAELGAAEAIKKMNKQSGLEAMAGSNDMREIIDGAEEGDENCQKAFDSFIDGVAGKIGEFAAKMGGIDSIVFTATIGERSIRVRDAIIRKVTFMGFETENSASVDFKTNGFANIATKGSKPILIVPTNEAAYMLQAGAKLLESIK